MACLLLFLSKLHGVYSRLECQCLRKGNELLFAKQIKINIRIRILKFFFFGFCHSFLFHSVIAVVGLLFSWLEFFNSFIDCCCCCCSFQNGKSWKRVQFPASQLPLPSTPFYFSSPVAYLHLSRMPRRISEEQNSLWAPHLFLFACPDQFSSTVPCTRIRLSSVEFISICTWNFEWNGEAWCGTTRHWRNEWMKNWTERNEWSKPNDDCSIWMHKWPSFVCIWHMH